MFVSTKNICEHTFVPRFINADSIVIDSEPMMESFHTDH